MKRRQITYYSKGKILCFLIVCCEIVCITVIIFSVSFYSSPTLVSPQAKVLSMYNNNDDNNGTTIEKQDDITMGTWVPSNASFILEDLKGRANQTNAINMLLNEGYEEYYFVMTGLDPKSVRLTDQLLSSADKTDLKIRIILLPPSEGGPSGNYDWREWIDYFNSLAKHHKSFDGFTIDDFNWISTRNDTQFEYNIDFMEYSKLKEALKEKREDVKFFPTIYFEGKRVDIILDNYSDFIDGLLLVSGCYYDVAALEEQIHIFDEIFDNKPSRYIVYPTITHNYSRYNYNPPSDSQVASTLSIAHNMTDGLIVWHDVDNPVIREFLDNLNNSAYLSTIQEFEKVQIEQDKVEAKLNEITETSQTKKDVNCKNWHNRYIDAYDRWFGLEVRDRDERWKYEIIEYLRLS